MNVKISRLKTTCFVRLRRVLVWCQGQTKILDAYLIVFIPYIQWTSLHQLDYDCQACILIFPARKQPMGDHEDSYIVKRYNTINLRSHARLINLLCSLEEKLDTLSTTSTCTICLSFLWSHWSGSRSVDDIDITGSPEDPSECYLS